MVTLLVALALLQDPVDLKKALSREIIGAQKAMEEIQDFIEPHRGLGLSHSNGARHDIDPADPHCMTCLSWGLPSSRYKLKKSPVAPSAKNQVALGAGAPAPTWPAAKSCVLVLRYIERSATIGSEDKTSADRSVPSSPEISLARIVSRLCGAT